MAETNLENARTTAAVTKAGMAAYGLAILTIVLDQASKHWVVNVFHLAQKGVTPLFGPVNLTMVWNPGVSFGLFQGSEWGRWVLSAFSLFVAIVLGLWARNTARSLLAAGLGLVMGGALGNLIDRLRWGAVADFIDVTALHFPWVFNIADAGINIGVALLVIDQFLMPAKPKT